VVCGGSEEAPSADLVSRESTRPLRIVSLAPAASEFVVALGAAARLVAVDAGSGRIAELADRPRVELKGAAAMLPDLILVGELAGSDATEAERLRSEGFEVIEVAPHDMADAFELCRSLGARIVGTAAVQSFELRISRELAHIGGSSWGEPRPRVLAVIGLHPFAVAGGHSFLTDLIEIAGGSSVTHEIEERRILLEPDVPRVAGAQLLLLVTPEPLSEEERGAALATLPVGPRVVFFPYDAERSWMSDIVDAARRLRGIVSEAR